jgi:hypothetical protein
VPMAHFRRPRRHALLNDTKSGASDEMPAIATGAPRVIRGVLRRDRTGRVTHTNGDVYSGLTP